MFCTYMASVITDICFERWIRLRHDFQVINILWQMTEVDLVGLGSVGGKVFDLFWILVRFKIPVGSCKHFCRYKMRIFVISEVWNCVKKKLTCLFGIGSKNVLRNYWLSMSALFTFFDRRLRSESGRSIANYRFWSIWVLNIAGDLMVMAT